MIGIIAAIGVTLLMALSLTRLFAGPTLYDRALVATSGAMKGALICAALAVAARRADWIDVSFALAFGAFVLNVAIFKFFRLRSFQAPLVREGER